MSNSDYEDEDYSAVQQRKDVEENLLCIFIEEENKNLIELNRIDRQEDSIDEFIDIDYNDIEKIKDIEENILLNELKEEEESICLEINVFNEEIDDLENELYEEAEKRKYLEESILLANLFEESNQSTNMDIKELESICDFDNETFEEIEKRKESEEIALSSLIEEEKFDDYIDEIGDETIVNEDLNENITKENEITDDIDVNELLKQIEDEQNNELVNDVEKETNIFPIPDCISCSSNDEKRSVTSITENESHSNFPGETPFKHKSMIPVQTGRKIPLPREVFETPSFRTQGRDKFDPHLLSEMKPKQKNNSKLHSSIPVNQGRKQMVKKSKEQVNKKDSKEQKESQRSIVKKSSNLKNNSINKKANEEESKNIVISKEHPPKTISKKQLKNLTERLAPITPAATKQSTKDHPEVTVESAKSIPQTPCCSSSSDIFNKLFVMSTCKKKMPNTEEDKVEETTVEAQPIMSAKSNLLALKKDIVKISNVVGDVDECDKENLERIMKELKIVDSTTTEEEIQMIEKEYTQCLIDKENNIYSAKQLESRILDSISLKKHRKFNIYVNRRLAIVRANEKPIITEQPEEKPEPAKRPTTMHRVTFDRLIAVKPSVSDNDNQNVSDIAIKKENEQVKLSKASRFILQKSQRTQEIMSMPLDQRDNYLMKRRNESIQKLEESLQQQEEKELKTKPSNLGALPRFYEQFQQELKQRPQKQSQNKKESEKDSFKPKIMSYNDFQKLKEKVYGSEPKVAGVEERIKRLRLARIERNELQEALDPRALPTELKNMKKKKNPVKKNVNINLSASQAEIQDVPSNEPADAVDNVLGI